MKGIVYQYKINAKYYVGRTFGLERKRKDKHRYEAFKLQKQPLDMLILCFRKRKSNDHSIGREIRQQK